jgi:hypothetical protein
MVRNDVTRRSFERREWEWSMKRFEGIFTVMVTAYAADGGIDRAAMAEMAGHLRELKERIAKAQDRESLLRLVTEVEETMLHENEDWRVVVRFNTPELPV